MAEEHKGPLMTLFDNMNAKSGEGGKKSKKAAAPVSLEDVPDIDQVVGAGDGGAKKAGGSNKRLSVERIYQKKTQLEHILLRPDTYIGSVEPVTQEDQHVNGLRGEATAFSPFFLNESMWVWDEEGEHMVQREITFVPGLYKIFDEILVNAADNKQRDPTGMNCIKIDIDPETNKIKIWNNGKGIPVVEHQKEKMFVPTLIFGHLLTSSNYNDDDKKVTGGRNGYGAKLCNIFSTKFVVETSSNDYKKAFKQSWSDNMTKSGEAKIIPAKGDDYTSVTFHPDLSKFKMEKLDKDIVDLFTRRAYDICATARGVRVFLNGKRLPCKGFKDYVDLYIKGKVDDNNMPLKLVHEVVNDRWEVGITLSDKGFQQVSFVNSIATTKGGRHVDYVTDQVVNKLVEVVKKKEKNAGINIKPFQVKSHMWIFVNCLVENPAFDSQTKESMTTQVKHFGSKCVLGENFITKVSKCGIVESIQSWMRFKQQTQLSKKMSATKASKLKGIPKLDDANDAGTKNSLECSLILTEGDSAKTLAVAGLGVVGRDKFGVFPLRGKMLNVRDASHKQIMDNAEINNVIKIIGLRYKEKYDSPESLKSLRYGKIMIMTDQDQDGSHIKGLLVNFIHHNWPNLLKHNFLEEFITPIVKVTKKNEERCFYSLPEFEEWKSATSNWHTWKVKYYKGLGTSTSKEAKEYFSDMRRHRIPFKYTGPDDDNSITLAFSKKKIEERKEWLTNWMEERKRRSQLGLPELYLYGKDTRSITFNEFVNRELILFSNMDNERSIPSLVDGLKPGQRKVLFTCFKRNLNKELKVAQLAGSVAELSSYHHGEASLMSTIINLAQNFVGSNNVNLLQPIGQFGTRLHGGKDAASPRYIFTQLSTLARHLFNVNDDPLLKNLYDDNLRIEPEWYVPIIPTVLVNGADGIGTGWSTKIPNYDVREICKNMERMLDDLEPLPMMPSFKNFRGTIEQLEDQRYVVNGEVAILDNQTIEITELPVRTWTQAYKESVLEPMLQGTEKVPALINDYKEYHTDTTVKFVVKMSAEKLARAEEQGLHKVFKLQTTIATSSMVLFDSSGCIHKYNNVEEILKEFYTLRLDYYQRRKDFLEGMLAAESLKLDNIARFIIEKIDGTIVIENKPKKEIIQNLVRRGYDPDPVKTWKEAQNKLQLLEGEGDIGDSQDSQESSSGPDFNYLLTLPMLSLTKEKKEELVKNRDAKAEELYQLRKKTPKDLWRDDLKGFLEELDKVEEKEREDDRAGLNKPVKGAKGAGGRAEKMKKAMKVETQPSPHGMRVAPKIDPSLRARAEAAATKKRKAQEKKENVLNFDEDTFGDDENEPKSLAERLGNSLTKETKPKKEPKEKKPRVKKASGSPKKGSPKKGKKKRNPWSDSEDDEDAFSNDSDGEMDVSFDAAVPLRDRVPRRTAAVKKTKYYDSDDSEKFSSDDEENMKINTGAGIDDDSDFDVGAITKSSEDREREVFGDPTEESQKSTASTAPSAMTLSDNDDVPSHPPPVTAAQKKEPPKKRTLGKKADSKQPSIFTAMSKTKSVSSLEDDSDLEIIPDPAPKPKKSQPKKAAILASDSENDLASVASSVATESQASAAAGDDAPKKKAAPKRKKKESAFGDSDEEVKPKKKVTKKKKAFDDSGSEDEFMAKPKKSTAARKKKKADSDDDFGMDDDNDDSALNISTPPARSRGGGRSRAPVKYNFGESDEDEDF